MRSKFIYLNTMMVSVGDINEGSIAKGLRSAQPEMVIQYPGIKSIPAALTGFSR
ncbi:MAG TPA: hypothetical protein VLX91_07095 [Candidatus Acidoferrales bacterium]|nr:hypothetical protein [Candidatus Acidoferrales bacterium]